MEAKTWFWGWRGTLVPRPNKLLGVVGRPLGVPSTPIAEPSQQLIDEWHAKYLEALMALFEASKASAGEPEARLEVW